MGRSRKRERWAFFERLESRRHLSTVNVNPANFAAAIKSSNPGDTINFAPGNYTLTSNPTGPAAVWPSGRSYVGNGATLALSGGMGNSSAVLLDFSGPELTTQFTGFVCTDAALNCSNGIFDVTGDTFENGTLGIFLAGNTGSHFDHNTFTQLTSGGIYGYPGNNNTYDYNTFDYVFEPIHLSAVCDGTDISDNIITHATRMGIELQLGMTHLTVENNWIGQWMPDVPWNGHCGISCATGGQTTPPYSGQGEYITLSGNTILESGADVGVGAAMEIMGGLDVNVTNNYVWGWNTIGLNGTTNNSLDSSDNVIVGGSEWGPDAVPCPLTPAHGSGDKLFALRATDAPVAPATPGIAPATAAPAPAPVAAPKKKTKTSQTPHPKKAKVKPAPKPSKKQTKKSNPNLGPIPNWVMAEWL